MVGPYGQIDIRTSYGPNLKREYVEGSYWEAGLYSPDRFVDPHTQKAELAEPLILVSNLIVEDARELIPVFEAAACAQASSLIIIANQLSDAAIGLMRAAGQTAQPLRVIGVHTPEVSAERRAEVLPDMAILLGGRPFIVEAGDTLERIRPDDFGRARRAWANRSHFWVLGGQGDPRALRTHLAQLRAGFQRAETQVDRELRRRRIGKLLGGSATLWVGGRTPTETEWRKATAERLVRALRGALLEGVVPGGGAALLACQPVLQRQVKRAADSDERAAYHILCESLEVPTRILAANAGFEPGAVLGQLRQAGAGWVFDVIENRTVDAAVAGLYDSASVVREAVFSAVSSAALALTIDVLVHHRKINMSLEP
jgi:chaperonin GroEL